MTDYKAAADFAKYVIDPDTSEDLNNLAATYLELRELAKAISTEYKYAVLLPSMVALRKVLEE